VGVRLTDAQAESCAVGSPTPSSSIDRHCAEFDELVTRVTERILATTERWRLLTPRLQVCRYSSLDMRKGWSKPPVSRWSEAAGLDQPDCANSSQSDGHGA
jgi:hypothetical protein